jgi:hypothetical protein
VPAQMTQKTGVAPYPGAHRRTHKADFAYDSANV